ncbi:type IV pilus twitching motility protein PilT [Roseiconus lacunae]|uniref:PilT/PilU family type 4a pilus ATPase n=1 Tax=Roseiconus lacunae TaxID=2605694 RepID=A0ABT7PIM0_9BACT|nr:PilT/PilU family type 4a pilus ATPase [Roseiconus lacunae]MCD0461351.1 PilT/PilU family type 4a pilus ATPase [Roseiconus lacunae]MDM4016178.1 PilT/PilU family type 4a pilus ATPase [Roseiconus lacunae]WRQ51486.1 PilT/PilU family type 4a pilus ATPase [Stieleria sp. HD01]
MAHKNGKSAPAAPRVTQPTTMEAVKERLRSSLLKKRDALEVDKFFRALVKLEGSDLHMKVGQPPMVRVGGELKPLNRGPIDSEEMVELLLPMMDERNLLIFEEEGGADFAYLCEVDGVRWRFRVNMLKSLGNIGLVARRINNFIPDFRGLFLPDSIEQLCHFEQGMVLLAGVTGSGKSTTIGSMLNYINSLYRKHILTLEDPIEFIFTEDKCLINQREMGQDVKDFNIGMKHAVREDPDIILVGELRDEETFMTAIHAAETGHLVFGTIHAASASTTIGRILDLFPEEMHNAIRSAIAFNMKGIVAQKLLRSIKPGVSRVPTCEVMTFNPTIRKLVLEGKDEKLPDAIRIGAEDGMQDFTMSLKGLIDDELIDRPTAFAVAPNKDALKMALKGIDVKAPGIL